MSTAAPWRLPIRDALTQMVEQRLDGDVFLRSLMHHDAWLVSGQLVDGAPALGVMSTERGRILEVYSDEEALASMERTHGTEFTASILRLEGHALFARVDEMQIDRINLNPGSEPKLSYRDAEQMALLAAWARQARVELALLEPARVDDPANALATYYNYHLVYQRQGEGSSIVLAPDTEGRSLGAIFSSWGAADAFCRAMQAEASGALEVVRITASELFPMMQRMRVQGLVFNPWTSIPARALRADILDELIPRAHGEHRH